MWIIRSAAMPKGSAHTLYVPIILKIVDTSFLLQRIRAAHALRSDQNISMINDHLSLGLESEFPHLPFQKILSTLSCLEVAQQGMI